METKRGWLAFTLCVACSVVAAGACGGDDATSAGPSDDDASVDATSDAPIDAGTGDAADGAVDTSVTVTVLNGGTGFAGAIVVFYKPDGTALPPLTAGADGKVSMNSVAAGSSVTVSAAIVEAPTETRYDLTTFMSIEPGDALTVNVPLSAKKSAAPPTVIFVTPPGAVNDAGSYVFSDGCQTSLPSALSDIQLAVTDRCLDAGTLNIAGLAESTTFEPLASTQQVGVTFVDGGTVTGFAWSPVVPTALPVSGVPQAGALAFLYNVDLYAGALPYFTVYGESISLSGTFVPPNIAVPSGTFMTTSISTALLGFNPGATSTSTVQQVTQAATGSGFSVDFASMPPQISEPILTGDGAGSASLALTAAGALTSLAGLKADISFDATPANADAGVSDPAVWHVVAPPSASITLPKLTSDLVSKFPSSATSISVEILEGTAPFDAYRSFRRAYPGIGVGAVDTAPYRVNQTNTNTM